MYCPCESCPVPLDSLECRDCRFNEDNWVMPKETKDSSAEEQ